MKVMNFNRTYASEICLFVVTGYFSRDLQEILSESDTYCVSEFYFADPDCFEQNFKG
jgi:hypothetical protein